MTTTEPQNQPASGADAVHPAKPFCCHVDCNRDARWEIIWPPFGYEDNTQSCDIHLASLMDTDSGEYRVYRITSAALQPPARNDAPTAGATMMTEHLYRVEAALKTSNEALHHYHSVLQNTRGSQIKAAVALEENIKALASVAALREEMAAADNIIKLARHYASLASGSQSGDAEPVVAREIVNEAAPTNIDAWNVLSPAAKPSPIEVTKTEERRVEALRWLQHRKWGYWTDMPNDETKRRVTTTIESALSHTPRAVQVKRIEGLAEAIEFRRADNQRTLDAHANFYGMNKDRPKLHDCKLFEAAERYLRMQKSPQLVTQDQPKTSDKKVCSSPVKDNVLQAADRLARSVEHWEGRGDLANAAEAYRKARTGVEN